MVSEQVQHKPSCISTEDDNWQEKQKTCTYICVTKTKALISFAESEAAKLICTSVFVHADCWFSHAAAQMFDASSKITN